MMVSESFTFISAFSAVTESFVSGMCKPKLNLFLSDYKILVKHSLTKRLQARKDVIGEG